MGKYSLGGLSLTLYLYIAMYITLCLRVRGPLPQYYIHKRCARKGKKRRLYLRIGMDIVRCA